MYNISLWFVTNCYYLLWQGTDDSYEFDAHQPIPPIRNGWLRLTYGSGKGNYWCTYIHTRPHSLQNKTCKPTKLSLSLASPSLPPKQLCHHPPHVVFVSTGLDVNLATIITVTVLLLLLP
ncbi:hypothetical protein PIB30_031954 [Stylosanthes scabra]|uniref:Uncharacterized protein n=1 Tax=Stylosanthes scabra TaxID=79078 RepID=A0ABU6RCI3_9FABA|nr:hypothetical protein [Stylosanthes scabra]